VHVRRALTEVEEGGADSVVSVVEVPKHFSPGYGMRIESGARRPFLPEGAAVTRRREARPAESRDGTVSAVRRGTLQRHNRIHGPDCRPHENDAEESLSIDTPRDVAEADRLLGERSPR
jgi:hypothetical protein